MSPVRENYTPQDDSARTFPGFFVTAFMQASMTVSRPTRLLCRLDLAYRADGTTGPTIAGDLLFAELPNRRVKGAIAGVRIEGRDEAPLTGNLATYPGIESSPSSGVLKRGGKA